MLICGIIKKILYKYEEESIMDKNNSTLVNDGKNTGTMNNNSQSSSNNKKS